MCEISKKNEENIQNLVDLNEILTESKPSIVAAIEQCHRKAAKSRIKPWITKDRWYQKYSLSDGYDNRNPSKKVEQKSLADKYAIGDEISSIEAVNPELQNDTRPRFFDNVTKTWTLLDSKLYSKKH